MTMKTRTPSIHPIPQRVIDRIFDNYDIRGEDECWPWKLSTGSHGYGQIGWQTDTGIEAGTTAHRVMWIAVNGPIPEGLTVDHRCRNRPCGNPRHLRLRTNVDNARDNGQGDKTHCPAGHAYSYDNTYQGPTGGRRCRQCARERRRN
jgi:hypothetical protein